MNDTALPMSPAIRRALRVVATAVLLALPLAASACGAPAQQPTPAPSSPPPAAASNSAAPDTPSDQPPPVAASNLAELAQRPCAGLDQRDADALGGIVRVVDGVDQDTGEKTCTWLASAGYVSLTVRPTKGLPGNSAFTRINIGGHDALQNRSQKGDGCGALVSTAPDQSFLIVTESWPQRPTSDPCDTTTRFAAAILTHLGPP